MTFDTDGEIPTEDLVKQWGVPHQQVASLISGAKRMSPDGGLAADFVARGYPVETHPAWFGGSHHQAGKGGGQGGGGGNLVDLGEVDGEEVVDKVFAPKEPVPKEQDSQDIHSTAGTAPGAADSPSNTISAAQQNILQQNGITYEAASGIWVKTVPQGAGQYVERVNPVVELRKLQQEASQRSFTDNIADDLLDTLSLMTHAFLKKVARVSHET